MFFVMLAIYVIKYRGGQKFRVKFPWCFTWQLVGMKIVLDSNITNTEIQLLNIWRVYNRVATDPLETPENTSEKIAPWKKPWNPLECFISPWIFFCLILETLKNHIFSHTGGYRQHFNSRQPTWIWKTYLFSLVW